MSDFTMVSIQSRLSLFRVIESQVFVKSLNYRMFFSEFSQFSLLIFFDIQYAMFAILRNNRKGQLVFLCENKTVYKAIC